MQQDDGEREGRRRGPAGDRTIGETSGSSGQIIEWGLVPKSNRERQGADVASERIRNLAFQASKLPTTLSLSDIEELGLAVLNHVRSERRA